ncbi:GTP-binding protein [Neobacillus piezotolerans]|uniref:GTP-binding protein n=1 Tax=Neobacillus piezotolerans TaxID=2259171 RepID=A0A3D8GW58_9BACI|nr:putative glycoside hydrolase [Neobacillus piezotolerans]RDU38698.1 GTP-binding protein [Neobacillus piezotolerans]
MNYKTLIVLLVSFLLIGCSNQEKSTGQPPPSESSAPEKQESKVAKEPEAKKPVAKKPEPEGFKAPFSFDYPKDGVKGIYVTGPTVSVSRFEELLNLVEATELNSMVIDIKDDFGKLQYKPEEGSRFEEIGGPYIKDPNKLLKTLEEKKIYPIARVVVFKDSHLATKRPDLSFTENGKVWKNKRGESFVNPFMKEVWEYNVQIAKEVAKMGFKDIQFDYVRFPEGFETRDSSLKYSQGDYSQVEKDNVQKRVDAVTDFVAYAKKELEPFNVDVSVDIFGYSATLPEAPGIGQNFSKISANVDAISSMIYPSHWTSYFGIEKPDLQPYEIINEYAKYENKVLDALENRPISRPWIQDFTASYLGAGNYKTYGKAEVEAQIRALNENGIKEFLLWNASNRYTKGVDYTPLTP